MSLRQLVVVLSSLVMLMIACDGGGDTTAQSDPTPSPTPTTTATASPSPSPTPTQSEPASPSPTPSPTPTEDDQTREWASCEHPEGLTVEYPADWHVNDGDVLRACSAFDTEPIKVPKNQEFFDVGVLLTVEPVPFSQVAAPEAQTGEVLDRRAQMVDGHDGVRVEAKSTGEALPGEGIRSTRWFVVLGAEKTLIATTYDVEGQDYDQNQQVLDAMVERLQIPLGE